ncbi:hypothetical protein LEN26_008088 [Aphanomyces euteiches]|nr:hypothetical protein AeMF1_011143 [Aphanomyces euteiches]KAH9130899.1 hypothetical protein LEN26_008088 [Aphanomyces euteiches]KAH9197174.1 hypothetical protein AeNC1_000824 [Aphanomyces euteiches]
MATDEQWTFVGRKGKGSRKTPLKHGNEDKTTEVSFTYKQNMKRRSKEAHPNAAANLVEKVQRIQDLMRLSPFYVTLVDVMAAQLGESSSSVFQLVCYGLGSFTSTNAAYQLACAALIREWLMNHETIQLQHACLYDPIMTSDDTEVAKAMGFEVLGTNEQGQRKAELRTLFFMPHCGKKLYQNVLLSNWGVQLEQILILGNSFAAYDDRVVAAADRRASIFSALVPYHREISVGKISKSWDEYVQYDAAFNDLSLHVFCQDLLQKAEQDGVFARSVDEFDVGTDEDLM